MSVRSSSVSSLVPASILSRIENHGSWDYDIERYMEMDLDRLYQSTESHLKNLGRIEDRTVSSDADLRLILVPELWERLKPNTRRNLRRISSTLVEYLHESRKSLFFSMFPDSRYSLLESARQLKQRVEFAQNLDTPALLEWTKFAISGAKVSKRWPPEYPVYEPAFAYRLVPVLSWRVLHSKESR